MTNEHQLKLDAIVKEILNLPLEDHADAVVYVINKIVSHHEKAATELISRHDNLCVIIGKTKDSIRSLIAV